MTKKTTKKAKAKPTGMDVVAEARKFIEAEQWKVKLDRAISLLRDLEKAKAEKERGIAEADTKIKRLEEALENINNTDNSAKTNGKPYPTFGNITSYGPMTPTGRPAEMPTYDRRPPNAPSPQKVCAGNGVIYWVDRDFDVIAYG